MAKRKNGDAATPVPKRDPNEYRIVPDGDELPVESVAKVAASPISRGASSARAYASKIFGEVDITAYVDRLAKQSDAVTGGDLTTLETTLTVQAGTLDAIFNRLALQAAQTSYAPTQEVLLRMALKAQAQCANTIKVLGELKNPKAVIFAKQANMANQQQVNNGVSNAIPRAHEKSCTQSNELLEHSNGEWLDAGAAGEAGRGNQALETVGEVDRPRH